MVVGEHYTEPFVGLLPHFEACPIPQYRQCVHNNAFFGDCVSLFAPAAMAAPNLTSV